jgi:RNA polymerase sigma factor (sigma-70 family)
VVAPTEKQDLFNQVIDQNKAHFHFLIKKYAHANDVQDLYQEIMYKVWKGMDGFEGRSDPSTWAYSIAVHEASTYKRNNFRRDKAVSEYEQDVQTEQMGGRDEERMKQEFEQSLGDEERKILSMYMGGASYKKMAEVTGIPEPILRVKINRLKNQFKQRYL